MRVSWTAALTHAPATPSGIIIPGDILPPRLMPFALAGVPPSIPGEILPLKLPPLAHAGGPPSIMGEILPPELAAQAGEALSVAISRRESSMIALYVSAGVPGRTPGLNESEPPELAALRPEPASELAGAGVTGFEPTGAMVEVAGGRDELLPASWPTGAIVSFPDGAGAATSSPS